MAAKYCIAVAERLKADPNFNFVCEMFEVVWFQDVIANPEKYQKKIRAHISVGTTFPEEMVASMPNLKVVSANGVGVNHLDIGMYNRYGVKVGNTPDVLSDCTADQAMALILASARKLAHGFDLLRKGQAKQVDHSYLGKKVTGSTLGIVGMGGIGYKVAEKAQGFQMKVLYHNRNKRPAEEEKRVNATYCGQLDDLLAQADFVLLTAPLTANTKGIISTEQFKKMKSTAYIINLGRGPLIDTDALVAALKAGDLAGAGLDVTDPEPLPAEHPLLHMPNVIVTPHLGSATVETRKAMLDMCVENIKAGIEGRPLASEVLPS